MSSENLEQPLYISRRLLRNLWQPYRIYTDRVELRFFLGRKIIRAEDIIHVEVRPPLVIGDIFRGKGFARSFALKLDMTDFCRHVAIHRRSGWIKHICFTPDDPESFVSVCKSIMKKRD
ncbi:MAG: hypothetical protein JXM79_13545 [Sedimentisphaerales bacterium]|nr:hypothetical protein [Sedimentisphaerales bacterium]